MIDAKAYFELPYYKQLHVCVMKWLENQRIKAYERGKLVRQYYVCRSELMKLERQDLKNVAMMLSVAKEKVGLKELARRAAKYVRRRQEESSTPKEYKIDLERFMRS